MTDVHKLFLVAVAAFGGETWTMEPPRADTVRSSFPVDTFALDRVALRAASEGIVSCLNGEAVTVIGAIDHDDGLYDKINGDWFFAWSARGADHCPSNSLGEAVALET